MSAQRISLSAKPVVAGVLALLALVAAVNAVVFAPGRSHSKRAQVRVQAAQPLPGDVMDLRQSARQAGVDLDWPWQTRPRLRRDPFGTEVVAQRESTARVAAGGGGIAVAGPPPLVCEAILLGGAGPTALINGKLYKIGEEVAGFSIEAVGTAGVKLIDRTGKVKFLSVYPSGGSGSRGRIVNGEIRNRGLGSTSLVEHARGERK